MALGKINFLFMASKMGIFSSFLFCRSYSLPLMVPPTAAVAAARMYQLVAQFFFFATRKKISPDEPRRYHWNRLLE
jgi:hypothetical protein